MLKAEDDHEASEEKEEEEKKDDDDDDGDDDDDDDGDDDDDDGGGGGDDGDDVDKAGDGGDSLSEGKTSESQDSENSKGLDRGHPGAMDGDNDNDDDDDGDDEDDRGHDDRNPDEKAAASKTSIKNRLDSSSSSGGGGGGGGGGGEKPQGHRPEETDDPNFDPFDLVTSVVECDTTQGSFTIDVRSAWAPLGAPRFLELVEMDMFTDLPFFRVAPRYITQFGPKFNSKVKYRTIKDDPSLVGHRDMDFGNVFFAGSGKDSRDDQMVIALCDVNGCKQTGLGHALWEVSLGTIRKAGWPVLERIQESGRPYPKLEMPGLTKGATGPDQSRLRNEANYLKEHYPGMEYFKQCRIIEREVSLKIPLPRHEGRPIPPPQRAVPVVAAEQYTMHLSNLTPGDMGQGSEGDVVIKLLPENAPMGVTRFMELIKASFFDNAKFFRVGENFVAQFGIAADPNVHDQWRHKYMKDDPHGAISNKVGTISFATSGKNTRSSQLFINLGDNTFLDTEGFEPVAEVISGMDVVRRIYHGYGLDESGGVGDGSDGKGPKQSRLGNEGNAYLNQYFPKLSGIKTITPNNS